MKIAEGKEKAYKERSDSTWDLKCKHMIDIKL